MKMAAELKLNDSNNSLQNKVEKKDILTSNVHTNVEYYTFQISDVVTCTLSIFIFVANIATDLLIIVQCHLHNYTSWMYITLGLLIIPIIIIQVISLRLHQRKALKISFWIINLFSCGMLQRNIILLKNSVRSIKRGISMKSRDTVLKMQCEISAVCLLFSFLMDMPQSVIQIYIWTISSDMSLWTGTSVIVSFCSITWAVVISAKYKFKTTPQKQLFTTPALTVEILWRSGFLVSRIAALVLCALCTKSWFFVLLGLHWLGMTIWLSVQKAHLWITNWQGFMHNCLLGIINCFDYMQFQSEDRSWFKTWVYYCITITENVVLLLLFTLCYKDVYERDILILYSTTIVGGTIIGLINMILYKWIFKHTDNSNLFAFMNFETISTSNTMENNPREFIKCSLSSTRQSNDLFQGAAIPDEVTADKKSLLNNIVQSTDVVEKGIANRSFTISDELEISECKVVNESDESSSFSSPQRQKRRGICHSLEISLETDKINLDDLDINLSSHKRRGICSLMQLCDENTNLSLVKPDEDLLNNDKLLSIKDGQINIIKSIQDKDDLKLEVAREIDEKSIETRSHVSSIHDYENICPLGVARPPWCIRSWKGYTDIETYMHDDSVVRDRRRDTLTSTATVTTLSSEYSDMTYTSFPFRKFLRRSRQDDYLDTLTYELVDFESHLNNSEKLSDATKEETSEPTLFMAKPVVIDDRGGMLSLDTILEEHEDTSPKKPVNSLVATIDKIRTQMVENSPRHVYYHQNESNLEDIESRVSVKRTSLATVLFDSQYQEISLTSKYNNTWRYSPLSGCYNELDIIKAIYSHDKQTIPLINAVLSDSPILVSRADVKEANIKDSGVIADFCDIKEDNVYVDMSGGKVHKSDNIYETLEALIAQTEAIPLAREVKNKDDMVSQFKSDLLTLNTESAIEEPVDIKLIEKKSDDYSDYKTSLCKEVVSQDKPIIRSRLRRKFSLLRERFEPKSDSCRYTINHWSKAIPREGGISIILNEQDAHDSAVVKEKDNFKQIHIRDSCMNKGSLSEPDKNYKEKNCQGYNRSSIDIKEKRSIFLKQILSSPKIHGWSKKRTFSPNAKISQHS